MDLPDFLFRHIQACHAFNVLIFEKCVYLFDSNGNKFDDLALHANIYIEMLDRLLYKRCFYHWNRPLALVFETGIFQKSWFPGFIFDNVQIILEMLYCVKDILWQRFEMV